MPLVGAPIPTTVLPPATAERPGGDAVPTRPPRGHLAGLDGLRALAAERDIAVYEAYAAGAPSSRLAAELELKRARTATIRSNGERAVKGGAA